MKLKLHWQIVISLLSALLISILVKNFLGGSESDIALKITAICDFVGTLFLNALKMIIVPLIAASIISGMIGLGAEKSFGRMGIKTISFYLLTTFVAVIIGLLCVNIIKPGKVDMVTAEKMLAQAHSTSHFEETVASSSAGDFIRIFLRMIPTNVFAAASDNSELLGVIVFSLLFGFFITRLPLKHRRFQVKMWQSLQEVTLNMADLILRFAPIGVFALVTPKFIDFGFELFIPITKFTVTVLLALSIQFFGVMSLILLISGIKPMDHFRAMAPAILTAFSTSSSVTTLPITMECVEKTAGVSNRVSAFTLPLGATVNMNGTALYEAIVVVFIAQFYQITHPEFEFGIATQFTVITLALLTSIGVAGIPAASIVAISVILNVVGLPFEYIGIVLVVDRILDMCRSVVNIFSDSVGAVVIGKSEGETEIYSKDIKLP